MAGAIDNTAAAIGAGTQADYDGHLYMGSSSWIAAHVPFKKTKVLTQIASVPCAVPSKYLMMAMQSSGASNIAFLKDRIVFHKDGLIDAEPSVDTYRILDERISRLAGSFQSRGIAPNERIAVRQNLDRAGRGLSDVAGVVEEAAVAFELNIQLSLEVGSWCGSC